MRSSRSLVALLCAALVLPVLVAGLVVWRSHQEIWETAIAGARQSAATLSEHALRVFEAQTIAIGRVDSRIAGMSWDEIERSREVHKLLRSIAGSSPHIGSIWLIRGDGRAANSADFFPVPPVSVTDREYFRALKERDETHLGRMIEGRLKGNLSFNISRRRTGGGFDGLVLLTSSLDYFDAFWREALPDGGQVAALVRWDGQMLARHPTDGTAPPPLRPDSAFFTATSEARKGTFFMTDADGVERLYAFAKLGEFPAYMTVGLSRAVVVAPWLRQTAILLCIAALVSAVLASLVVAAQRRDRRLLAEIAARRAAETSLVAKEEHVAALERAEAALKQSEERFRSLFETLTQGVVFRDRQGHLVSANAAAHRILGRPASGLGEAEFQEIRRTDEAGNPIAPEEHPARVALRTGKTVRGFVMGIRTPTRPEPRWLVIDAVPLRQPGECEPSHVYSLISDVTDQKRAQDTERLLVAEVDHRAKNVLAVVQSVIRLTRAATAEQFVAAVEGRIAALSRAHTLLSSNHWEGTDLRELVEDELVAYRTADSSRITVTGPRTVVSAYATQSIAMVVHELTTNAAKYGALSRPEGRVAVGWSIDPAADVLELVWEEFRGPVVVTPTRMSFGSTLIRASVEGQLGGKLHKEWRSEGLRATIRLPARHFTESDTPRRAAPVPQVQRDVIHLEGVRVLVAEDNAAVALDMCDNLRALGCVPVGPAAAVEDVARLALAGGIEVAVLDVDLKGKSVFLAAELLAAQDVPILFCTGFSNLDHFGERWSSVPLLRKPIRRSELAAKLGALLAETAPRRTAGGPDRRPALS